MTDDKSARGTFGEAEKFRFVVLLAKGYGRGVAALELGFTRDIVRTVLRNDPAFAAACDESEEEYKTFAAEQKEGYRRLALSALWRCLAADKPNPLLVMFALQNGYPEDFKDKRAHVHEFKTQDEQKAFLEKVTGMPIDQILPDMKDETRH